jgi:MFS family permease
VAAVVIAGAVVLRGGFGEGGRPSRRPEALGRPTPLLLMTALAGLLAGAVGNSLPAFAVDSAVTRGIDETTAGLLLALGSAAAVTGRVATGWLADRRGSAGYAELAALTAAGAVAVAVLAASGESQVLFAVAILAAFAFGWGWPGLVYYATVHSHPGKPGPASAFMLSSVYVGNIVGPTVVGFIAEHRSYSAAWAVAAGILMAASLAAMAAGRRHAAQAIV